MASFVVNSSVTNLAGWGSLANADTAYITRTGDVFTPTAYWTLNGLTDMTVILAGSMVVNALSVGSAASNSIAIQSTGSLFGRSHNALDLFGPGTITNMGSVFGQVNAIVSYEAGLIVNSGTISAVASGVSMNLFGTGGTLANDGLSRADLHYGVNVVGGSATLTNHGTNEALGSANGGQPNGVYLGGSGSVLVNSGLIFGTYNGITLGADFSEQTITNSDTIQRNHAAIQSAETATPSLQTAPIPAPTIRRNRLRLRPRVLPAAHLC